VEFKYKINSFYVTLFSRKTKKERSIHERYRHMNDLKAGTKVEYEGNPYNVITNQFVKPGKGQAFNRVRIKNLRNGKVIEVTFKSDEKIKIADVEERSMRFTYKDTDSAEFMDDETFDQVSIPLEILLVMISSGLKKTSFTRSSSTREML